LRIPLSAHTCFVELSRHERARAVAAGEEGVAAAGAVVARAARHLKHLRSQAV
jgi:hypothetical protein